MNRPFAVRTDVDADVANVPTGPIRIETVEGPLGQDDLRHICELYGRNVDPRYSDLEFVGNVFNNNPAGHSFHAFAYSGKEAIGCYGVIPVRVVARGREAWGGKGEALYVRPDFRPAGLFLVNRANAFVANRGLELLFGLTRDRVGRMLTAMGFTAVPCVLEQRLRLNRPEDIEQLANDRLLRTGARVLKAVQATAGSVVESVFPLRHDEVTVNDPARLEDAFAVIASAGATDDSKWSVSVDEDSLRWYNSIGRLDVLSVEEASGEFVAVTRGAKGGNAIVLRWNVQTGGVPRALRTLQYIVDKSQMEEAAGLSLGPSANMTRNGALRTAASLLGFIPWSTHPTMYLKSADPFFLDSRNVTFTRFFSI